VINALPGTFYIIDTTAAAVTVNLPSGAGTTDWITIQNAPASGPQVGGGTPGHNITINAAPGETIEANASETLGPPVSPITAACRRYFPTSTNSGTGAGQAGITGWATN
jgi:hypothetical protein